MDIKLMTNLKKILAKLIGVVMGFLLTAAFFYPHSIDEDTFQLFWIPFTAMYAGMILAIWLMFWASNQLMK